MMALTELHNNISLYSAQEEFENAGLKNPKKIEDDIAAEKQQFSKLKFQYLEQETRDKFLRIILSNSSIQITDEDLKKIQDEASELKKGLKDLKVQMGDKQKEIDSLSEEFLHKEASFKQKYQAVEELTAEVQTMQQEYEEITKDLDLELMKNLDSINIEETNNIKAIAERQTALLNDQKTTLEQVTDELKQKQALSEGQTKTIEQLTKQLRELMITSISEDTEDTTVNNLGKWMNEMNGILVKFFDKKVQIKVVDSIEITVEDKTVVLDQKTLEIKSHSGEFDIETFNTSSIEDKLDLLVGYLLQV